MCEFCDEGKIKYLAKDVFIKHEYHNIYLNANDKHICIEEDYGENDFKIPVNYCCKCGRKL